MAPAKKLLKLGKKIEKRRMLGTLLIISFIAFGATVVTYYLSKAKVDITRAAIAALFIGGLLTVFIEMRGVMRKKVSTKITRIRTKRKKK